MSDSDDNERRHCVDLPILDARFKATTYALYDRLRDYHAVVAIRLPSGIEAWLVTTYAASRMLLNDARLSKDARHLQAAQATAAGDARETSHPLFRHLLTMDPPEHTRLRTIIAREFSSRRVELLRPRIHEIAAALLDDIEPDTSADLMKAFALPLPLYVICELLGIPAEHAWDIAEWSERLTTADLEGSDRPWSIADDIHAYLLELAERKRAVPDRSLFAALVAAHDARELTAGELTAMAFLLVSAGHETSANLIGNGVLTLLRRPTLWAALVAEPALAPAFVNELLRLESPLEVATARFATADIPFDDVVIRKGDRIFVGLAAANRDPAHFDHADELDTDRASSGHHIAFGHGVHYCIGAALARAEGEIALAELSRRYPHLALAVEVDDLDWAPGLIMRGLRRLPVRWR
jgi:cytochrome P450